MALSRLRTLAPIIIAVAVVVLAIIQIPRLGGFGQTASNEHPCQAEYGARGMAAGTPVPAREAGEAGITTALVVLAPANGVPLLQPLLGVQSPLPPGQHQQDVEKLVSSFLIDPEKPGSPHWDDLRAVLEDDADDSIDMGLFPEEPSIADQQATAEAALASGSPFPAVTPVVLPQFAKLSPDLEADVTPAAPAEVAKILEHLSASPHLRAVDDRVELDIPLVATRLDKPQTWAGGWLVKLAGQTMQFRIQGQPVHLIWHVRFCIEGTQILSVRPVPAAIDANRVVWRFDPDHQPPASGVEVVAATQHATWLNQAIKNDALGAGILRSWALLGPALLLWVGLWMSRRDRARDEPALPAVELAWRDLEAATIAVTRLAVLGVAALVLQAISERRLISGVEHDPPRVLLLALVLAGIVAAFATVPGETALSARERVVHAGPAIAFVVALLALVLVIMSALPWEAIWPPLVRALLVTGYFSFLLTAVSLWQRKCFQLTRWMRLGLLVTGVTGIIPCLYSLLSMANLVGPVPAEITGVVALLAALWVTACVVVGFALLAGALLPPSPAQLKRGTVGHLHALLAAAIVIVVVLVQWMLALYSLKPFSERATAEADPRSGWPAFFAKHLQGDVADYLSIFLGPALNMMPLLGLVGLVTLLGAAWRSAQGPASPPNEGRIRRIMAYLFAAFVVGYGGQVAGLQAPVAFLIGMLLFIVATSDLFEAPAGDTSPASGGVAAGAVENGMAEEDLEATSGPPVGWWQHGLLAVRLGSLLALLPIGYFIFVLLGSQAGADLSLSRFVPAGIFMVLAYEVAFWLVAAFVFGATFPYLRGRNGLVKGAVLALVYVGANLGAATLGVTGDALWRVRSFQLLLFLMLLGVWLDRKTFGLDWRQQVGGYELPRALAVARHLLPLVSALAVVLAQLLNNNTYDAITTLISGEAGNALLGLTCALGSTECNMP